ncbi:hypothetical protein [Magnetospirillum sp. LM-5]|uniref:hypothetical protein n=1 Tax=Magnetospirillum sp. LM-5 TaxID=2681466 RepID=UPI001570C658|nr:hypothetical protein [Magnetospirillum sp. LM-5]
MLSVAHPSWIAAAHHDYRKSTAFIDLDPRRYPLMMVGSHLVVSAALWAVIARAAGLDPAEPTG